MTEAETELRAKPAGRKVWTEPPAPIGSGQAIDSQLALRLNSQPFHELTIQSERRIPETDRAADSQSIETDYSVRRDVDSQSEVGLTTQPSQTDYSAEPKIDSQSEVRLTTQPTKADYSVWRGADSQPDSELNSQPGPQVGTESPRLNGQPSQTGYSAKAEFDSQPKPKLTTQQASRLTSQPKPKLTSQSQQNPPAEIVDLASVKARLTSQSKTEYDRSQWKKSRIKPGNLIRRREGYNLVETEYGVSYLFVVSRKPDRTSADYSVHPFAGFFNWKSLEESGLLVKEKKDGKRKTGNRE